MPRDSAMTHSPNSGSPNKLHDIQPIYVSTERDLQKELDDIRSLLPVNTEWTKRINAVRRLQGLAVGGAARLEVFVSFVKSMHSLLLQQVSDLRSSVAKEGCYCLGTLAECMGESFDSLSEIFIAALFKAVIVTTQVVSSTADDAVRRIIAATSLGFPRTIQKFAEGAKSKNQVLRLRCSQYIGLLCQKWAKTSLDRYSDVIAACIQHSIADAHSEVRTSARQSYWHFYEKFPSIASAMLQRLPANSQRYVAEERAHLAESSVVTLKKVESHHPRPLGSIGNAISNARERQDGLGARPSRIVKQGAVHNNPPETPEIRDQETKSRTTRKPMRVMGSSEAARVATSSDHVDNRSPSTSMHGPKRIFVNDAIGNNSEPAVIATQKHTTRPMAGAKRVILHHSSASADDNSGVVRKEGASDRSRRPQRVQHNDLDPVNVSDISVHHHPTPEIEPLSSSGNKGISLPTLLSKTSSDSWSVRLDAFEHIRRLLKDRRQELRSSADQLVASIDSHLLDPHSKVGLSALQTFEVFVEVFPVHAETRLQTILPKIFTRLVDPKESLRTSANFILNAIRSCSSPLLLLTVVSSKCLNVKATAKMRVAALEFIVHLLPGCIPYLSQSSNMRVLLQRLSQQLGTTNLQLKQTAVATIKATHKLCPEAVQTAQQQLPIAAASVLRDLVPQVILRTPVARVSSPTESPNNLIALPEISEEAQRPQYSQSNQLEMAPPTSPIFSEDTADDAETADNSDGYVFQPLEDIKEERLSYRALLDQMASPIKNAEPSDAEILRSLGKGASYASRRNAIYQVGDKILESDDSFWVEHFAEILILLLDAIQEVALAIPALQVLIKLLQHQSARFPDYVEVCFVRLIDVVRTGSELERHAAEQVLAKLPEVVDPTQYLHMLRQLIQREDLPVLASLIRVTQACMKQMTAAALLANLAMDDSIVSTFINTYNHRSAEVRKATVFALVELHAIVGEPLMAFLQDLTAAQSKLLTIYIGKRRDAEEGERQAAQAA